MKNKIKVLIIDDSALVRKVLSDILQSDKEIEVMGTAANPYFASEKIKHELPDVITLDVEMPRMDGLTFLKILMSQKPIPVIIISSLTERASLTTIKALELGAVDVVKKPSVRGITDFKNGDRIQLLNLVKAASKVVLKKRSLKNPTEKLKPINTAKPSFATDSLIQTSNKIVVIGASTGGTEAIRQILMALPYDAPPMAIVQHMPELYTKSFAQRLDQICAVTVKEASNGDALIRGQVLIAPGNQHMEIRRSGARYFVALNSNEPINRHRPSVDVLFNSAAKYVANNCISILLTGMGKDGAQGMVTLKESGAETIAQDEASSIVFGMPREAIMLGGAKQVQPLDKMASIIMQH